VTTFCANCDNRATKKVEHSDKKSTPLCETCATAYEWGQASPDADVVDIDERIQRDVDLRPQWTFEQQEAANEQGRGMFAIDGDKSRLEIQKLDEGGKFESDADAIDFVATRAKAGDELCLHALQLCRKDKE
jgi:hypothetical protein